MNGFNKVHIMKRFQSDKPTKVKLKIKFPLIIYSNKVNLHETGFKLFNTFLFASKTAQVLNFLNKTKVLQLTSMFTFVQF